MKIYMPLLKNPGLTSLSIYLSTYSSIYLSIQEKKKLEGGAEGKEENPEISIYLSSSLSIYLSIQEKKKLEGGSEGKEENPEIDVKEKEAIKNREVIHKQER